ncbi:cytochrome c oxidase assembly protein [Gracilibacillus alcaliphilus]|uniref:cytochrome c oxidase assembly protein n=1 Tax=Gracilibacillus alcaliphilus TaxID=1401441 RepID=UPI00195A3847|nr:cytochrome c oxidase assembly protein [Gracilibacillus alcaliphilus]
MNNHMSHKTEHSIQHIVELLLSIPFILVLIIYLVSVLISSYRGRSWSLYRSVFWMIGVCCCIVAVAGPLADLAHTDFTVHMVAHLLLGMLGPLLMVLGAPMTLLLRTLSVRQARKLTRILRSKALGVISNPIITSILNVGGLWILYTTNLYAMMHENIFLHVVVHLHVFLAGYFFTVSLIYIDPVPHRTSYFFRAIVLGLALAGHGILSKYIYAYPPNGVPESQARNGGMLMYYGGDMIDLVLIIILCFQWFKATKPRVIISQSSA